jgi:hypothetical protein
MKKEVQIHRIETRDSSNILTTTMGAFKYSEIRFKPDVNFNAFHLYATISQNIESIKVGDWTYDTLNNCIEQAEKSTVDMINAGMLHNDNRKIIATTDKKLKIWVPCKDCAKIGKHVGCNLCKTNNLPQFQQSFIKEYCDKGDIDKALVEYHFEGERCSLCGFDKQSGECINRKECPEMYVGGELKIKLNSDNTITIYPLEEKMYSVDEILERIGPVMSRNRNHDSFSIMNWIKENL